MARSAILATAFLLAGCMNGPPIIMPTHSVSVSPPLSGTVEGAPQSSSSGPGSQHFAADNSNRCAIHLADIHDTRPDPGSLGMMGGRAVKTEDSVAWVRAALSTLDQDRRLIVTDDVKTIRFSLRIELAKAYIMTITTQKSSNVVLRVSYSRDGQELDTQILRGRDTGGNWVNGENEARGSLNQALADAVHDLDEDIVAHCHANGGK